MYDGALLVYRCDITAPCFSKLTSQLNKPHILEFLLHYTPMSQIEQFKADILSFPIQPKSCGPVKQKTFSNFSLSRPLKLNITTHSERKYRIAHKNIKQYSSKYWTCSVDYEPIDGVLTHFKSVALPDTVLLKSP